MGRVERLLSRISVKWIMPVILVTPVVVVSVVLILLAYTTGKRSADEMANQQIEQIHMRIEEHLTRLLNMPPAINELNKRMLKTGEMSFADVDRNRKPVFETLNIFQAVSSVVTGKATGETMWVIRYPGEVTYEYAIKVSGEADMQEYTMGDDGELVGERLSSFKFDPTIRPWYRAAVEAGEPTWGKVYIWVRDGRGETLGIPYVEPYCDEDGKVLGVINCELTLSDISAYLGRLQVGKTGKVFIVERDGNLIANSEGFACMKNGLDRLPGAEAPDAWIAHAAQEMVERFGLPHVVEKSRRGGVVIDGQPMRVEVSPYRNRRNLDWLIVTLVPDADFMGEVEANRQRGVMLGVAAVAVMLLISAYTVVRLMRPILKLVTHVRSVGEGHLDQRIDLHDNREMVQLSQEINQMVDDLQDRLAVRHALKLAMDVQQSLLPAQTPQVKGVDLAARAQYCDETGGDYYDYLDMAGLDENSMVVALGDVMGHGVAAAMLMATARGMLRSHVQVQGSLGELLTHVNDLLVADTQGRRFMTMLLLVIERDNGSMRWASAGHDPPFIYDPADDVFFEMGNHGGLPLGVMEGEEYQEATFSSLRSGQVIVICTDGLWESRNEQDEAFNQQRLREAIREFSGESAKEIERKLYDRLQDFVGNQAIDDDVTYVVIKLEEETN